MKLSSSSVPRACWIALGVFGVLSASVPASAQTMVGSSTAIIQATGLRAVGTAYDPVNDVHLSLAGGGALYGRFTREVGSSIVPVSDTFVIFDGSGGFGHFTRAVYNPDTGQFLVVFQNGVAQQYGILQSQVISFTQPGYLVGGRQTLSEAGTVAGTRVESNPAVAYNTVAQRYLAAWVTPTFGLRARLLDINGMPIGSPIVAEVGGTHSVAVAAHPTGNYFGIANTAFGATSAWAAFRLMDSSGNISQRSSIGGSPGTFAVGVDVNTVGQYVMSWGLQPGTWTAVFDANGNNVAGPTFVSGRIGGDLSMGLAYNKVSKTFLVVSSDWDSFEIAGGELSQQGSLVASIRQITDGAGRLGSFYPIPAERITSNRWNVTYSRGYAGSVQQMVSSGGVSTAPPPSTPSPTPSSTGCSTPDPFAAIGGGSCVNGGWLPGGGSTGGSTGGSSGCSTPNPFASLGTGTCVNGGWVMSGSSSGGSSGGSSSGCSTPNPFASLGTGTCVNGGWVMSGSSSGGSSGGSSSGCSIPNPFASLGTGTCVNGGWVMSGSSSGGSGGGSSSGCSTPNPFASLGTGTCVNGGWIMSGSSSGGSSSGGCSTPNPFASLGTGTCVNGGWVMSGSSSGGSASGCSIPNPFASLGTGTCVNGGWIMSGSSSGGSSSGCTGADPFAGIGGGVCVAGGWVPASAPSSSCSTPNPFASLGTGTCVNGGWVPR